MQQNIVGFGKSAVRIDKKVDLEGFGFGFDTGFRTVGSGNPIFKQLVPDTILHPIAFGQCNKWSRKLFLFSEVY